MRITIIGAGNVGYHLGKRLHKKGIQVHQIFSRNIENAKELGAKINALGVNDLTAIDAKAALYILAVKDDAIATVAEKLRANKGMKKKLIVHTSGAVDSTILAPYFKNYGVFYPLQTFSKQKKVCFSKIPICIDAAKEKDLLLLQKIGDKISKKVSVIDNKERAILHIAAVIVNNFSNHLFHIGQQIIEKEKIDFSLLQPLIQETVHKIQQQTPYTMQTGPARRGDTKTIKKHLNYLQKYPKYAHLYVLLTKSIQDAYRR